MTNVAIERVVEIVDSELQRYQQRAVEELGTADAYLAGHLAGNINALATIKHRIGVLVDGIETAT